MFIVNQDRDLIQNMDRIGFIEVRGCQIVTECGTIARYKTEDRAKEVFEDMITNLTPAIVLQNVDVPEDMMEKISKSNFLIVNDDVNVEKINPIYQMPKE